VTKNGTGKVFLRIPDPVCRVSAEEDDVDEADDGEGGPQDEESELELGPMLENFLFPEITNFHDMLECLSLERLSRLV
jgi:hypothetical protein